MRRNKLYLGMILVCFTMAANAISVPASEKEQEPLANLHVITDENTINCIAEDNPRVKEYLSRNETFAALEIITEKEVIEKIQNENPDVKELMDSNKYRLAYVKGKEVRLMNTAGTASITNGILDESEQDWVLLDKSYSLNEKYLWWKAAASSAGSTGWIVNDYRYLHTTMEHGNGDNIPEVDFSTLKFVR